MAGNILPLPSTQASSLPPAQVAKIKAAAEQFEGLAIGQLIKPMFDTIDPAQGLFGGAAGEQAWRPMWINAVADQIAKHGGLGLAPAIMQNMLQIQEHTNVPS